MVRFKAIYKNDQLYIRSRLHRLETINEKEMTLFQSKRIGGFMRPSIESRKKIIYSAPYGIPIDRYLKQGIEKNDFFLVLAQVNEIIKKLGKYQLRVSNLVLSLQDIYINEKTKEVHFIYQPVDGIDNKKQLNIFTFIHEMILAVNLMLGEDDGFLNELDRFLGTLKLYSAQEMERYIEKVYPSVYQKIQRERLGKSQALRGEEWNYYEQKLKSQEKTTTCTYFEYVGEDTELLMEEDTSLLVEEDTSLLQEENNTTLLWSADIEDEMATTVLDEEQGTTLLCQQSMKVPCLIRIANNERVRINKSEFKVGKDKAVVDYYVAHNNAVSGYHCTIITRREHYYIEDHHSTNGTYVNGLLVHGGQEVEIFHKDAIMLGNEVLEFHID